MTNREKQKALSLYDTIGNVAPGTYQIVVFIIDKLGNVFSCVPVSCGTGCRATPP